MNITGDKLINLMFVSMTDKKIIEIIDAIGLEQPVIDEQYEMNLDVTLDDMTNSGLIFVFKEIDGYTQDGDPCLTQIDFYHDKKIRLPFNMTFSDNYALCCEKLEGKASFHHKSVKKLKIWVKEGYKNLKYSISINFKDKELTKIKAIVFIVYDETKVGSIYLENKE